MCGIAGKVHASGRGRVEEGLLRSMCGALVHRGPDDVGYYTGEGAGLGMRRLQVIDLKTGRQPMSNEDGTLWVVFNGEIYNYRELRRELQAAGHVFRTDSDTEVIVHLYEERGAEGLQLLQGMFAFAAWDTQKRSLFLARDRLGKKPLYYACSGRALTFASELTALLCDDTVDTAVDPRAIDEYLTYLFVPHPRTIYHDVFKLPPGSHALYEGGTLSVERYWQPPHFDGADGRIDDRTDEELVKDLDSLLQEAVQSRLMADVPVGAFLSGGLDSSLIVAMMQKASAEPVRTFSIGFAESSFNELEHARSVSEAVGTEHAEFIVSFEVQDLLPRMLDHFGEPFADSSAIPAYHLSKATRSAVTVALSGDGGDEVFGGYRRYRARILADLFNRWPAWLGRDAAAGMAGRMREPDTYYGRSVRKKVKRFLEFATAVRETSNTSWAFFLTRRKRRSSTRAICLTVLRLVPRASSLISLNWAAGHPAAT